MKYLTLAVIFAALTVSTAFAADIPKIDYVPRVPPPPNVPAT